MLKLTGISVVLQVFPYRKNQRVELRMSATPTDFFLQTVESDRPAKWPTDTAIIAKTQGYCDTGNFHFVLPTSTL